MIIGIAHPKPGFTIGIGVPQQYDPAAWIEHGHARSRYGGFIRIDHPDARKIGREGSNEK
jgi:hypothetical protein